MTRLLLAAALAAAALSWQRAPAPAAPPIAGRGVVRAPDGRLFAVVTLAPGPLRLTGAASDHALLQLDGDARRIRTGAPEQLAVVPQPWCAAFTQPSVYVAELALAGAPVVDPLDPTPYDGVAVALAPAPSLAAARARVAALAAGAP